MGTFKITIKGTFVAWYASFCLLWLIQRKKAKVPSFVAVIKLSRFRGTRELNGQAYGRERNQLTVSSGSMQPGVA